MLKRITAAVLALLSIAVLTVALAAPARASDQWTCFGYTGTFADPIDMHMTEATVSWPVGGDNCFGISPGRQIWITSPGHPWAVIPGNGRADGLFDFTEDVIRNDYGKTVKVWVASSGNYFCQTWWSDTGWNDSWRSC